MDTITPVLEQVSFRGRDDDVGLNTDTWNGGGAKNADWSQAVDVNFRTRFEFQETAGGEAKNIVYTLRFNHEGGGWTVIGAGTALKYADTTEYINLAAATQLIGSGGSYTNGGGVDNTNVTGNITLLSQVTECEWALQIDGASVNNGDTIDIRVYNSTDAADLDSYTQEPTITVIKGAASPRRIMVVS